jgi:hypothetical protein
MVGSFGADVGIDGVRDGAVGAACLVLVDERDASIIKHYDPGVARRRSRLPPTAHR